MLIIFDTILFLASRDVFTNSSIIVYTVLVDNVTYLYAFARLAVAQDTTA